MSGLKEVLRALTPPIIIDSARAMLVGKAPPPVSSEMSRLESWPNTVSTWDYVLGESGSEIERAREEDRRIGSLGFTATQPSELVRSYMLAMAYAVARAADGKASLSVLDFGGGMGLYSAVARQALPNKQVDYTIDELPAIAKAGAMARPHVRFISGDAGWAPAYDLVFAQGSLQYIRNWRDHLTKLARVSAPWLYLARVMVFKNAPTTVVRQTIPGDQFTFWCWNETELLDFAGSIGLAVEQTFQFRDAYERIVGVDEVPRMCGYLFRRVGS